MADSISTTKDLYKKVRELSKTYNSLGAAEFIRSGSVVLDAILGGGIPKGVMITWSAENGCGKSTGALHICKIYCMQGKRVLYLDYESGVNAEQIESMGLTSFLYNEDTNPEGLFMVFEVQTYKDGEKILDAIMSSVDLVVIDSATSILTEKIKGSSSEDVLPGQDARVTSIFLKRYKAEVRRTGVSWIIINQMRTKISFTGNSGNVEAGGNAMKFYPDIRISMKRAFKGGVLERVEETAVGEKKVPFGSICEIWTEKNRYERPKIPLKIAIIFGKGISNEYAYEDFLENDGCIVKSGAWYTIKGIVDDAPKLNGMGKVIEWIYNNRDIVKDYINEKGGYRLLLNKESSIDISGEGESETVYDGDVVEDFDNVIIDEGDSEE